MQKVIIIAFAAVGGFVAGQLFNGGSPDNTTDIAKSGKHSTHNEYSRNHNISSGDNSSSWEMSGYSDKTLENNKIATSPLPGLQYYSSKFENNGQNHQVSNVTSDYSKLVGLQHQIASKFENNEEAAKGAEQKDAFNQLSGLQYDQGYSLSKYKNKESVLNFAELSGLQHQLASEFEDIRQSLKPYGSSGSHASAQKRPVWEFEGLKGISKQVWEFEGLGPEYRKSASLKSAPGMENFDSLYIEAN